MQRVDIASEARPWFALRTKPRWEKIAAEILHNKGYDEFLPLYKSGRRWSDRYKELELPLFPGYLFCRLNSDARAPVLTTPGVLSFVGIRRIPLPVEDSEIEAVRTIIASGLAVEPWPFLQVGSRVRIEYGALKGLEGILLRLKSRCRLVVSVTLLQRSVSVEIDRYFVTSLGPSRAPSARAGSVDPRYSPTAA